MTAQPDSLVPRTAALSRRSLLRSAACAGAGAAIALSATAAGMLPAAAGEKRRGRKDRRDRAPRTHQDAGGGAMISAARIASGNGIAVRGHGFRPRSEVQILINGSEAAGDFSFLATAWTNANGFFAWTMGGYEPTRLEVTAWQIGGEEAAAAWTD